MEDTKPNRIKGILTFTAIGFILIFIFRKKLFGKS